MSEENIVRRALSEPRESKVDWAALDAKTDAEIEAAVRDDPDAAPLAGVDGYSSDPVYCINAERFSFAKVWADYFGHHATDAAVRAEIERYKLYREVW